VSAPPTPFSRLILFCDLVDEYDELAEAFPVTETSFDLLADQSVASPDRWPRIVRAMALRKFALGKTDQVYVPRVLDSAAQCATDDQTREGIENMRHRFAGLALAVTVDEGAATNRTAPELIEDYIYGGLLHGDYRRHLRVKERPEATHDLSLLLFVTDVENYIRLLARLTRRAIADGQLVGQEP